MPRRLPLPVRRNVSLTEPAYERLRRLNQTYGLGNNYLLVVLLENLDRIADPERLDGVFRDFIAEYGAPATKDTQE
jgi:hypothetical protein